jgi:tRNA(Leu) C34 or U34 (ribose-2'-O)-methylase TrmL
MRGYSAIGLYQPKSDANVGSVLRAAGCFDAALVAIEGQRYRRSVTDTTKMYLHMPVMHGQLRGLIPYDCVPVAVELSNGARSLHSYTHPERAFYIFGPEDGSIPVEVAGWCRDSIYVPTHGCLNLAAAVNIVLYDRDKKRARDERILEVSKQRAA